MTTDNRANEPTAEQILWELYPDDVMDHNRRANCHLFLEQLRTHGLLSEGAPRDELIERAARAIRADYVQRYPEEPPVYHAGAGQPVWRHMARAALTAAGVATQPITDEQIEAVARSLHETPNPWFVAHGSWEAAGFEIKQAFRASARTALRRLVR